VALLVCGPEPESGPNGKLWLMICIDFDVTVSCVGVCVRHALGEMGQGSRDGAWQQMPAPLLPCADACDSGTELLECLAPCDGLVVCYWPVQRIRH
jgi:hypothetical protein